MAAKVTDPSGGATHYCATSMPKTQVLAKGARQKLKLGNHIFYKTVP